MKLNLSRPLIVFDLETTGVNVGKDRIVEICMIKIMPDGEEIVRTERINPTIPIPPETTAIHGISDEDIKDKPTFAQMARDLNKFIDNSDLAGFNAIKFDIPLLVEEFLRADIDFDVRNRRLVDTQNIFHKMEPRNLSAAYRFYCDKNLENAHTAEADTRATSEILKAQIERYENKSYTDREGQVSTPVQNDINALSTFSFYSRNADLVGQIIFNKNDEETFNFGKHKGKTVEEVFEKEPAYYDWMMRADFPLSTKRLITAIKLRGFNKNSVKLH